MKNAVLVATPDLEAQKAFQLGLREQYEIQCCATLDSALQKFSDARFEFTFLDVELLESANDSLVKFKKIFPTANIVVLAKAEMTRLAVSYVKKGAKDFLNYPIDVAELKLVTTQVDEKNRLESEVDFLRDQFWNIDTQIIVKSVNPTMKKVFDLLKSVASTRSTVLLTGETGVGKSMFAKIIHDHSDRRDKPFIPVHCGAISENLIESELFGHEKGAFTGAIKRKLGKFELAQGGTIFLDEIGTISSNLQIKLLQVLQDSTFQRVGGEFDIKVDVRIIVATNENLKEMVEEKTFRRDLYHRISVFPVDIPPVRERKEDIPGLLSSILNRLNTENTKNIESIAPEVVEVLTEYEWSGNVREMENVLERAFILESTDVLTPESLPIEIMGDSDLGAIVPLDTKKTLAEAREEVIENFERQYLKGLLLEHKGKINETAAAAGVGVRQIHKLMTKYGISKSEFRVKEQAH